MALSFFGKMQAEGGKRRTGHLLYPADSLRFAGTLHQIYMVYFDNIIQTKRLVRSICRQTCKMQEADGKLAF